MENGLCNGVVWAGAKPYLFGCVLGLGQMLFHLNGFCSLFDNGKTVG